MHLATGAGQYGGEVVTSGYFHRWAVLASAAAATGIGGGGDWHRRYWHGGVYGTRCRSWWVGPADRVTDECRENGVLLSVCCELLLGRFVLLAYTCLGSGVVCTAAFVARNVRDCVTPVAGCCPERARIANGCLNAPVANCSRVCVLQTAAWACVLSTAHECARCQRLPERARWQLLPQCCWCQLGMYVVICYPSVPFSSWCVGGVWFLHIA